MPRVIPRRPKWKDTDVVVASQSLVGDGPDGVVYVVKRGMKLRGDDTRVQLWPCLFLPGDTLESELPPEGFTLNPTPTHEPEFARARKPVADDESCVAVESFMASGRSVRQGQRLRRDDPLVRRNLEFFAEVPKPLKRLNQEEE